MESNKHIVFIFGAPDLVLDESQEQIPEIIKLEFYHPVDEIHKYYRQPMVIRYLMDSDNDIRCWGCHRLLNDYAYPHNFNGHPINQNIVLCCSHSCQQFIKYYKKAIACICCGCEYIPHSSITISQSQPFCPVCKYKSWSGLLKSKLDNYLTGILQPHLISVIHKFMEINTAIINNRSLVSEIDT